MLDPKQTLALVTVVREGSFQAAARVLNVTPAAVTQRIKLLESTIGALVLVRGKNPRLTPQGKAIVAYAQKSDWLEQDLMRELNLDGQMFDGDILWRTFRVAVNADSLATWFLPGVAATLAQHHLLLDVVIDDQDHTHAALRSGQVMGCVTTLAQPIKGCVAQPLGVMRYRCLARHSVITRATDVSGHVSVHQLLKQPAIVFNRKDALHDKFLLQQFGLKAVQYPKHFFPALDAFESAVALGLGWGMVPDVPDWPIERFGQEVSDVVAGAHVDIELYWQHWAQEPPHAALLTEAVKAGAERALHQDEPLLP